MNMLITPISDAVHTEPPNVCTSSVRLHATKLRLLSILAQKNRKIPILIGPLGVGKKTLIWELVRETYFGTTSKKVTKRNFYLIDLGFYFN